MLVGCYAACIENMSRQTNLAHFGLHYGLNLNAYAQIWEDMHEYGLQDQMLILAHTAGAVNLDLC